MNSKDALPSPGRLWRKNENQQQQSISHKELETSNLEHVFKNRSWLSAEVSYSEMALGSERQVC